jgi:ABC-type branched-subunit amino acid transport system permease subunit
MLAWVLAILGIGALLAGALALVIGGLLLGPLVLWLAWNVLDLAHAVGAPELGFWGFVLAAVFLAIGLAGRAIIVAAVFLIDPDWFHGSAQLHWPDPTFRNFVAICLILIVASVSSHPHSDGRRRRSREPAYDGSSS